MGERKIVESTEYVFRCGECFVGGNERPRLGRRWPRLDAGSVSNNCLDHCFHDLEQEARAVFRRATVFVGAQIGTDVEELVEQVVIAALDLHAVEPAAMALRAARPKSATVRRISFRSMGRGTTVS